MTARALMCQGTGSDVGKSLIVAGLCQAFARHGLRVRPFKPQNMSNNAAVSDDGGEIGRAQALQARASGVASSVHMNPVLLKPQSEMGSQVVVQGKVIGNARAREYQTLKPKLMSAVLDSYARVRADADMVLVEGAGSAAEINLRWGDLANMGFARAANCPVALIGDIDRGGIFAQILGVKRRWRLRTPRPSPASSSTNSAAIQPCSRAPWRGGRILGICGGYQMLGKNVSDPQGMEGPPGGVEGLKLLDVATVLTGAKALSQVKGVCLMNDAPFSGYEMHIGETKGPDCARVLIRFVDERVDGAISADGRIAGAYVHGLFADDRQRARGSHCSERRPRSAMRPRSSARSTLSPTIARRISTSRRFLRRPGECGV